MCHVEAILSVCLRVFITRMYCAKVAEPIEMPFWGLTHVVQRNHVDWGQDRTNPFDSH